MLSEDNRIFPIKLKLFIDVQIIKPCYFFYLTNSLTKINNLSSVLNSLNEIKHIFENHVVINTDPRETPDNTQLNWDKINEVFKHEIFSIFSKNVKINFFKLNKFEKDENYEFKKRFF